MSRILNFFMDFFGKSNSIKLNSAALQKPVAEIEYMRLAICIAANIISDVISKCPVKFYYDDEINEKSLEYYRWNIAPNKNQNGSEFKSKIVENLIKYGDCLVIEDKKELFVADDFVIDTDGTKPYKFSGVSIDGAMLSKTFKRNDVLYFKLNQVDRTAMLNRVYSSYGQVLAYAIASYKTSKGSKWKLKISANSRAEKNFKEKYEELVNKNLRNFFENNNSVLPEFDGYDLSKLSDGNNCSGQEITELRKDIFQLVAQTYKIPQALMNGETIADDIFITFLSLCIEPIVQMLSAEVTKQYFCFSEWCEGSKVEFDTTSISISAISNIAQGCEKLIGSGVMNIDEVRQRILGLNALNTELSQKYFVTRNFADIEKENGEGG